MRVLWAFLCVQMKQRIVHNVHVVCDEKGEMRFRVVLTM